MEENELYDRIGETDLNPTYKDGQTYQHTDINQMLGILKTAINENYYDIQRLLNGAKTVGNANQLDGATLSRYIDETLQADDNKIPSSQQAKAYMDDLFAGYSAPVRGEDYWTDADKKEIIDNTATAVVDEITPSFEEALAAKANINDIPTKISDLQNDSDFLSENNLQMVNVADIENRTQLTDATGYSRLNKVYGDTSQTGTPTPENPVDVNTVTGNINIKVKDINTNQRLYTIPLGDIELCKIGTNQDYIYRKTDGWYLHKEIGKKILNGTEQWFRYNGNLYIESLTDYKRSGNIPICTHYKGAEMTPGTVTPSTSNDKTIRFGNNQNMLNRLFVMDADFSNANTFKEWLSTHNIPVYYILTNSIETKIVDNILIDALDNTMELYEDNTIFEITSEDISPKINITYSITNRDFYSKEEADDVMNLKLKNISNEFIKVHAVAKSSATYIVELRDGKNLIVDTGQSSQFQDIKSAIDGLGITRFDYMILTHFHSDHIGNVQNICDNYDLSNCKCWVGMKPDFTNHGEQIGEAESSYNDIIALLNSNGINPIVPEHNSYYEIDENTKLHFLNTSPEIAENYYGRITEYRQEKVLNFNHFSLVTELVFNDKVITFTGDIERVNEEYLNIFMRKADIITSPHHGVNIAAYKPFYENIRPQYSFNMYITSANTWIHPFYNSFMYQKELGCHMITPDCTEPINGLFSFDISRTRIHFLNNGDPVVAPGRDAPVMYTQISQIYDRSETLAADLTLEQLFETMLPCSTLQVYFWGSYQETYPTLYNDIVSIFPTFTTGKLSLFKDVNHYKEIEVSNNVGTIELRAISTLENYSMRKAFSRGIIPNTGNTSVLITELQKYPPGHYFMDYFTETEDNTVLVNNGAYQLDINIVSNNTTGLWANIFAVLRNTDGTTDVCRAASCYINTTNTPQYKWLKLN